MTIRDWPAQIVAYLKKRRERRARVRGAVPNHLVRLETIHSPERRHLATRVAAAAAIMATTGAMRPEQAEAAIAQIQAYLDTSMVNVAGGTVPQSLRNSFELLLTPEWFGAVGDGVHDDSVAINLAFTSGHKVLHLRADKLYYCASDVTVPAGCRLVGPYTPGDNPTGNYATLPGAILLNGGVASVHVTAYATAANVAAVRAGMAVATNPTNALALVNSFVGNGFIIDGDGQNGAVRDCIALGFAVGFQSANVSSPIFSGCLADCTNGFYIAQGGGRGHFTSCDCYPFLTVSAVGANDPALHRAGNAFEFISNCDWSVGLDCASFGYAYGFVQQDCSNCRWTLCDADNGATPGCVAGFWFHGSCNYPGMESCTSITPPISVLHATTCFPGTYAGNNSGILRVSNCNFVSQTDCISCTGNSGIIATGCLFAYGSNILVLGANSGISQLIGGYASNGGAFSVDPAATLVQVGFSFDPTSTPHKNPLPDFINNALRVQKVVTSILEMVPVNGSSLNVNGSIAKVLLNPAGALTTMTLTIDADGSSIPGEDLQIRSTQSIGTLHLYQGGGIAIYTIKNLAPGRTVSVWNAGGTLYAGIA